MEKFERPFMEAKKWISSKSKNGKVSIEDALNAITIAQLKYDLYHEEEFGFLDDETKDIMEDDINELMK